ncbi:MAG: hypothetical protein A2Y62_13860 [Candidatus Fischerbacteria bacterium RBG_13_37_8]|uniref:Uncharacterized protein n=1 Tax=Candidatus Fischerbacteria bacterium RBG_13_37_8 TaxID=1817863 RepID=A0A1F5VXB9_9BACT|nr:MAG: hypothetical protein A2Y62_13860 [Candidatus Fischerbacteria bacterium RBG_13_37_8]
MDNKNKRPLGISIISILNIVAGLLIMLASFGAGVAAQGVLLFAIGIFALCVGIGLRRMRPWARSAAIFGYVINIVSGLVDVNIPSVVVACIILVYLFSTKVKEAFSNEQQVLQTTTSDEKQTQSSLPESNLTVQLPEAPKHEEVIN